MQCGPNRHAIPCTYDLNPQIRYFRAQAVELTLGLSEADLEGAGGSSFGALGGDSLAAIQFARAIDDLCGVPLPVSFVLGRTNSLDAITAKARLLEQGFQLSALCVHDDCEAVELLRARYVHA